MRGGHASLGGLALQERPSGRGGDGAGACLSLLRAHPHFAQGGRPGSLPLSLVPASRVSPAGDGQLFRSVEGQAASDEEAEGEKWPEERRSLAEVKSLLARLSSCRNGCEDQTAKKLLTSFGHCGGVDHACTLGELEARVALLVEQLGPQGCSGKTLGTPGEEVS